MSLTLPALPKFRAALAKLGPQMYQIAGRALYREAERIMADSKQNYVPVDMGILRSSGFVKPPVVTGSSAVVEMGYGGAASSYALYVHEGTGPAVGRPPFMPPVEVIRRWARRHGIDEAAAFPIARAIGRRGLRPLKYLEQPANVARNGMDQRLAADVRAQVARMRLT